VNCACCNVDGLNSKPCEMEKRIAELEAVNQRLRMEAVQRDNDLEITRQIARERAPSPSGSEEQR
jgi:hypothetical protein